MGITVSSTLGELESDLRTMAVTAKPQMASIVKWNVEAGNAHARKFARESAGPHGKNYYKRITSEMTSPLSGVYGPTGEVVGNAVGAGWRHGHNTDLDRSADIVRIKLERDVSEFLDDLFWPGA